MKSSNSLIENTNFQKTIYHFSHLSDWWKLKCMTPYSVGKIVQFYTLLLGRQVDTTLWKWNLAMSNKITYAFTIFKTALLRYN